MATQRRHKIEDDVGQVQQVLARYKADHPGAVVKTYRSNSYSIRIRVIDPGFKGIGRVERDEVLWRYLDDLPPDVHSQITMLLLETPAEAEEVNIMNVEFDHPLPSNC